MAADDQIEFCTLGMFIIDEIHFPIPRPPVKDILGGAGSYSALGARLFSPGSLSKSVGWIVDCGSDFPHEIRQTIDSWDSSCLLRETPERLTTRGWNEYGDNEYRAFKYLTPKLRLEDTSLSPRLLSSKLFHLICSPTRCASLVHGILERRTREFGSRLHEPLFIWEPVPDVCIPEELGNCLEALKLVHVVSPNHAELSAFFGSSGEKNGKVDFRAVAQFTTQFRHSGIGPNGTGSVVVRCGKEGCFISSVEEDKIIPAYHQDGSRVVDPTGGGNTFLGGLGIGLARRKDIKTAALWGSVAASFAIEQIGVPDLSVSYENELWNGESVSDRYEDYVRRLQ